MKILKLLFLVFVLCGIGSCKKILYEKTPIKVTIIDDSTHLGLPNVKVILHEDITTKEHNVKEEIYTNANGVADFGEVELRKSTSYNYYIDCIGVSGYTNVQKGKSNNIVLKGWGEIGLSVKFIPPPPYNAGDSLSVTITNALYPNYSIKINNSNYASLSAVHTMSSGYQYVNINKYKSGVFTNTKDTVFYNTFTDTEYDINW